MNGVLQILFGGTFLGGDPDFDGVDDTVESVLPTRGRQSQPVEGARWPTMRFFDRANASVSVRVRITKQFFSVADMYDFLLRYPLGDDHGYAGTAVIRYPHLRDSILDTDGGAILSTDGVPIMQSEADDRAFNWLLRDAVLSPPDFSPPDGTRLGITYTITAPTVIKTEDDDLPMWDVDSNGRAYILYAAGTSTTWSVTDGKFTYGAGSDSVWTLTGDKITLN